MTLLTGWLLFGILLAFGYHLRDDHDAPWWFYALMVVGSLALFVFVLLTPRATLVRWAENWRQRQDGDAD